MPKLLYTWYFEKFTASFTSSDHSALRHEVSRICTILTKANARLSFIKRNLKDCPQKLKEIAYFSLVRSFVDYASAVWDPHQKFNQVKLEMVQRRAARFVKSRYKRTDRVTAMLDELGWPILSKRRKDVRLILFYKTIVVFSHYVQYVLN